MQVDHSCAPNLDSRSALEATCNGLVAAHFLTVSCTGSAVTSPCHYKPFTATVILAETTWHFCRVLTLLSGALESTVDVLQC